MEEILSYLYTYGGFIVVAIVCYLFLIRPDMKRKKEQDKLRAGLALGDKITTIGGITGVVCIIKDDQITIETGADRVRIQFERWAVSTKKPDKEEQK